MAPRRGAPEERRASITSTPNGVGNARGCGLKEKNEVPLRRIALARSRKEASAGDDFASPIESVSRRHREARKEGSGALARR